MAAKTDVKIVQSGTTHKFRLLQQQGRKFWQVSGPEEETRVDIRMDEASFGSGLKRAKGNAPGTNLRIANGFGVDLTEQGLVVHGPGSQSVGSYVGTALQTETFENRTALITTTDLHSWTGSTLDAGATLVDARASVAFHNKAMYIAAGATGGNARFFEKAGKGGGADWSGALAAKTTTDAVNCNFIASVYNGNVNQVWIADDNKLYVSVDVGTPSTFALKLTMPDDITNLWVQSGFLFFSTQAGPYIVHENTAGEPEAVEINSKMRSRRNDNAFSILDTEGQDTWGSDGKTVFLLRSLGFNEFNIDNVSPFETTQAVPFTSDRGTIIDISIDLDAVYITTEIGGNTFVYKGVEKERGLFVWSPLIRITGSISMAQVSAHDGDPFLYVGDSGTFTRYKLKDWTVFNTSWEIETPFFNNNEAAVAMLLSRMSAQVTRTGGEIQASFRLTDTAAFTNIGAAFSSDVNRNMGNATGKEIQLKFVMSGNTNAQFVDLHGFQVEGVRRPEHRKRYTFTVVVDSTTEATFLHALAENSANAPVISRDKYTQDVSVQMLLGWPREVELFDEVLPLGLDYRQRRQ